MEDRHARQVAEAIKSAGSVIAFAIFMGSIYVSCIMSTLRH